MSSEGKNIQEEGDKFIPNIRKNSTDVDLPLTKDTTCGIGPFKWDFLQKFANKNVYVAINGVAGAIFVSRYTYYYGTISTLEKRFKIPSRNIGYQSIGNEVMFILVVIGATYFAGKGHKPRWIGFGFLTVAISCFLMALPHFIYGGGSVETLTLEHGHDPYEGLEDIVEREKRKDLCNTDGYWAAKCDTDEGHLIPQVIFFCSQMFVGLGTALMCALPSIYMDDNIKKEESPIIISIMFFLNMTGPLLGFSIAGICLKYFVNPSLTPTIENTDPRWVGLWWFGWIVIGSTLLVFSQLTCLFPKILPDAAKRKHVAMLEGKSTDIEEDILPASWTDFRSTIKRLLTNKVYMLTNIACIFSIYGAEPYFMYTPKYIESLYQKTPTESNFYTGTIGFIFASIGTILSGAVVSRFKPSAKRIVQWTCLICVVHILSNLAYSQLSCPANEIAFNIENLTNNSCSANCNCDFVQFAPVCGEDGQTYISSCHAGCTVSKEITVNATNATKIFTNCSCIESDQPSGGYATEGACPINCDKEFTLFLSTMSFLRFMMATGIMGNYMLWLRCVAPKDKTISIGFGTAICSIFAYLPMPVVFGAIVDSTCDLWGKTCTTSGNCWLYNGPSLRYFLNFTTCFANILALCFNIATSKFVKDIEIFDEEEVRKNTKYSEETQKQETRNL